jgi:excisionase family DNA binding protein
MSLKPDSSEREKWLTLRQAAELLDVHPRTLRRWADDGSVPFMLTPGGHRRFSATDVARLTRARRGRGQAAAADGIAAEWAKDALAEARKGIDERQSQEWLTRLDDVTRHKYRSLGRRLVAVASKFIAGGLEKDAVIEEARSIGHEYAGLSKESGMRLMDALETSMYFRETVVNTALRLAEELRIKPEAEADLVRRINLMLNNVQLAVVEVYDADNTDSLPRT